MGNVWILNFFDTGFFYTPNRFFSQDKWGVENFSLGGSQ